MSKVIHLNREKSENYENKKRTASLVKLAFNLRGRKSSLTPEQLYSLCQLTWLNGDKNLPLNNLWGVSVTSKAHVLPGSLPPTVNEVIEQGIGFTNFYKVYRGTSKEWIKKHFDKLIPLVELAAELKSDGERIRIVKAIEKLPKIPSPNKKKHISASSLLTPLFACLDPKNKFPIINKAPHVMKLHRELMVVNNNLEEKFSTLLGLIGQNGIKDAFLLDVIADKIPKLFTPKAAAPKHDLNKKYLDDMDDTDVEYLISTHTVTATRLHNSMTNKLKTFTQGRMEIYQGEEGNKYDLLIPNYNGRNRDLLIEVKSNIQRPHLRLAVGQLFDYRRKLKRRAVTDLAVLLPDKPNKECISYLEDIGIEILWFIDEKLSSIEGTVKSLIEKFRGINGKTLHQES